MNASHDIERDLARWMEVVAPSRAPDTLAPVILERTRSMQPRPGWLARLMEPPMQTQLSLRNYFGVGRTPRLILVGLLILALTVGGIVVGSQLLRERPLPPPFGLAGNGLLASNINGEIILMEPDGSSVQGLALPFEGVTSPSFSRDGTRIAAWATRGGQKSLIVANVDGSGAFEVDRAKLVGDPGGIDWSPDDRRLAFSASGDRLYVADIDARTVSELGRDASIEFRSAAAWAPDGRLAYKCMTVDGVPHLCVMSADFQVERMLQTSAGTEYAFQEPSWSHDGRSIAYQVDDAIDPAPDAGNGWDVATIDVASGKETVLTRGFDQHTILPIWSPDDRHVLFLTASAPGVVRSDGTGLRLFGQSSCTSIVPSPDGAFATCPSGKEVVLFPIEGGGQPTVIEVGGVVHFVNWQRVAD
jgi:dipeptidyl aminopeptidase/acylaminoacyl peptidase